jgi:hypothetical protein
MKCLAHAALSTIFPNLRATIGALDGGRMTVLRSLAAIFLGYVTMVACAWFAQEGLFPGVKWGSPIGPLLALGFSTASLAGVGGAVTAMLAPRRPYLHLLPMTALITLETGYLYAKGVVHGPLWFEAMAGASIIAGTFIAAWLWLALKPLLSRRATAATV